LFSRRSLAVAVITGASYVGAVVAFALTPWIIQHYGWRQVR
jgi:predicted MFS family arabinose efflux permease